MAIIPTVHATEIVNFGWSQDSVVEGGSVEVSGLLRTTDGTPLAGFDVDLYFFEPPNDPGSDTTATPDATVTTDSNGVFSATFQTNQGDAGLTFRCRAIFRETLI